MDREALAQLLYEIDQRIHYGHVKTPWAERRYGASVQHHRKVAEQLLMRVTVQQNGSKP